MFKTRRWRFDIRRRMFEMPFWQTESRKPVRKLAETAPQARRVPGTYCRYTLDLC